MDRPTRAGEPRRLATLGVVALISLVSAGCVTVITDPNATHRTTVDRSAGPSVLASGSQDPLAPTPRPTAHPYRVRGGDTLYTIARRFGLTIGQLLAANPDITDPDRIAVGQVIIIPPPDAPDTGPNSAGIGDSRDDVTDADGNLVAGQSYTDITGIGAELQPARLFVEIVLIHAPPLRVDPEVEVIRYTVVIDVEGDGQPDYRLIYGNDVDGQVGFAPSFEDRTSGEILSGSSFPGTLDVTDRAIRFRVNRGAFGDPRRYAIAVKAERFFYPGGAGDPEVEPGMDMSPDQQWPRPNPRWVEVGGI